MPLRSRTRGRPAIADVTTRQAPEPAPGTCWSGGHANARTAAGGWGTPARTDPVTDQSLTASARCWYDGCLAIPNTPGHARAPTVPCDTGRQPGTRAVRNTVSFRTAADQPQDSATRATRTSLYGWTSSFRWTS